MDQLFRAKTVIYFSVGSAISKPSVFDFFINIFNKLTALDKQLVVVMKVSTSYEDYLNTHYVEKN